MTLNPQTDREFLRETNFYLGELPTPIRMRLFRRKADGKLLVEQSHFLKSSIQYLPYAIQELQSTDESVALQELEGVITNLYGEAVRRGYEPKDSWLVPNPACPQ